MSSDWMTMAWLIGGALLVLAELVLPGLVALFLGLAAILVAGLRWLGLVESLPATLASWMGLSVALTFGLRRWMMRLMPGERRRSVTDEGVQALGTIVEVTEAVSEDHTRGRIRYQGTTWPAQSTNGALPKGAKAQLVVRREMVWWVEPLPTLGDGQSATLDEELALHEPVGSSKQR